MKHKINLIAAVLFLALIFGFTAAFVLIPDNSFSEQENRSLRTLPRFTWQKLTSGEYAAEINNYFADQFPLRDALVGLKGGTELLFGKGENNGILLGRNGQLAQRLFDICSNGETLNDLDTFDPQTVQTAGERLTAVADSLDIPFCAVLTGRSIDVAAQAFDYPRESGDRLREAMHAAVGEKVSYLDTVPLLREKYEAGEYVYYRTDHHWTTLGAYYAYTEVMRSFGMEDEIIPMEAFDRQTVATDFYGTAWSAGGMKTVPPDSMEFWMLGNESDFAVTADGVKAPLYRTAYLAKKDKYSAFPCGTHDVVTVVKQTGEARPTLLILKDSFANSMVPFLMQHFDLAVLNLSSAKADHTNLTESVSLYGADYALLVYTLENVIGSARLGSLR